MNIHKNARLTPHSRAELVRRVLIEGQAPMAVATAMGVTVKTVRKWVGRFAGAGSAGLIDRSSRPHRLYRPTPEEAAVRIERLRRRAGPASRSPSKPASRRLPSAGFSSVWA